MLVNPEAAPIATPAATACPTCCKRSTRPRRVQHDPNLRGGIGSNDSYFKIKCLSDCPIDITGWNLSFTDPTTTTFTLPARVAVKDYTDLYIFMDDASPGHALSIPGSAMLVNPASTPMGACAWNDLGVDLAVSCGITFTMPPAIGTPMAPSLP